MPNKIRFTQENSTTIVAKPEIVPLMTARKAALDKSRDMLESTTPYDNYMEAKDFGIIGKLRSQIGSKLINKGASNCTLSATNCYGDTYGTARSIVSGKTRFKEIPVDSIQPGDLVIQSLPGVPDGTENKYHTMIYDHKAPWTYVDKEGDLVREGDMLFNYSRGKKSKGQYVQKAKSFTDKNEGKTHYRYYRLVPELSSKIRFHQNGGKAYYIKSLDNFIKNNSKLYGINTKDFRDFFIELVGLESSYNSKATNNKGNYGGWYATLNGANLSEYEQHKAAFKHLSKLFKENITDLDITTAKDKGITQAQLLAKYWNQGNRVTNYIHNNIDDSDGLGTKISEYGNGINVNIDYSGYTPEAITDPYVIVENNKTLPNSIIRFRGDGINYSDRENSVVNTNKIVYEKRGKKEFNPNKVQVGDTIWGINPFIPNPPKELVVPQLKLKSGGIVKRFSGGLTTGNEYADLALSFVPVVGSIMDISNAIADPSFKNIATAAVSTGLDLLGGRLITGALKSARFANRAIELSDKLPKVKNALESAQKNFKVNPTKGNRANVRRRFREYKETLAELNEVAPKNGRFRSRRVSERKMPENWSIIVNPYTVYGTDAALNGITQFDK